MAKTFFEKYKNILITNFLVSPTSFENEWKDWMGKRGDNEQSKKDFIWSCFNQMIDLFAKVAQTEEDLYTKQKEIYMSMWGFLIDENRDARHIKKQIHACDLRIAQARNRNSPFRSEIHVVGNNCCAECDKIDRKIMSIDEALSKQLLPYAGCTRENGCLCCYADMTAIDGNGRLIPK